jgi:hypothetical protein
MGQSQRDAIAEAIDEVMTADDDEAESLCCTIEATASAGESVTIQVMQDSLNIAPYAYEEDPLPSRWRSSSTRCSSASSIATT